MSRADMIVLAGSEVVTMTSLEMVDFINSERRDDEPELLHKNFLAKVPEVLGQRSAEFLADLPDSYGRSRKGYRFPKREACLMAMSYSYELQAKVYDRMTALESAQIPKTLPDALRLAADLAEKAQIAAAERDEAIRTKALIGSRREASAMGKASAAVRIANKLRDQLGFNTRHATVTAVENATGEKYEWLPLRKWCKAHGVTPETIPDKRYGEVKAWPADAWGEVYGVDLAEVFSVEACA